SASTWPKWISHDHPIVPLWALLFVSCGPTVAQSVAVFDFELVDTSLEGAIRGARHDDVSPAGSRFLQVNLRQDSRSLASPKATGALRTATRQQRCRGAI